MGIYPCRNVSILLIIILFIVFIIRNIQGRTPLGCEPSMEVEGPEMKNMRVIGILVPLAVVLLTQCAAGLRGGRKMKEGRKTG